MTAAIVQESTDGRLGSAIVPALWHCCAHAPGVVTHPDQLTEKEDWIEASVPGTVAAALLAANQWDADQPPDIDSQDWWFRTTVSVPDRLAQNAILRLDGLATLAEVWWNGELLLTTDNMFRRYSIDVASRLQHENELAIRFKSLTEDLKRKRPRPRWKTNLVNNQQLRWHRTSLHGRIPGWSPSAPVIGPWRNVILETGPVILDDLQLLARLESTDGVVAVAAAVNSQIAISRAFIRVGSYLTPLTVKTDETNPARVIIGGSAKLANVRTWWPHTHGKPSLYECELVLESDDQQHLLACPSVGFRSLDVVKDPAFQVRVNGEAIYCRGACWTIGDSMNPTTTEESLRHDLTLARDAGVNMLRVIGTMTYESDTFYRLCDELGVMVWQDFMFANMDYPVDDVAFRENLVIEATEQITRLASHPSVTVYCGNSEIQQQASMLGMPRDLWSNSWFAEQLPSLCAARHPGAGYIESTPIGGTLPFQPRTGLTHYYGVGAYLRPISDVRRSDVKFTAETLGFANIPDPSMVESIFGGSHPMIHDPRWKRRVPRDTGAGWDFDDVRDHYLRDLFNVDPVQLRSFDMQRYLELSRLVPGEMMHQVYSEWRSGHSHNNGALAWFYKDLRPGAGWGIVDSTGTPKATYYYLKRAWASCQVLLTDEGLNGLDVHLVNESEKVQGGTLEVTLLKEPNVVVARQEIAMSLEGRTRRTVGADEILGGFYDVTYAYRFGPAQHDIVIATWLDSDRTVISEAYHFVRRSVPTRAPITTFEASAERIGDGAYELRLQSDRFVQGVQVLAKGYLPDDNCFHLAPQRNKRVVFRTRSTTAAPFKVSIEAASLESSHVVSVR